MIAIEQQDSGFHRYWVAYCLRNGIPFKRVDCYRSDIVEQLRGCDALMWHFSHQDYRDMLFARQLIHSLDAGGMEVFPDPATSWHFDDKVGQKYLLEAVGAPLVPTWVFYTAREALAWSDATRFPKVFKLRGGSGASNVMLARTRSEARRLIRRAFGRGFSPRRAWADLKERWRKYRQGKTGAADLLKGFGRLILPSDFDRLHSREKGYAYFQEFIPGNTFDIRVVVVGNRACALRRNVRRNDFRASGSGEIVYDRAAIDSRCVEEAFRINRRLGAQCLAYDFVFDAQNRPLIVEISYGFTAPAYEKCDGYWLGDMTWHAGSPALCDWMIEDLLDTLQNRREASENDNAPKPETRPI